MTSMTALGLMNENFRNGIIREMLYSAYPKFRKAVSASRFWYDTDHHERFILLYAEPDKANVNGTMVGRVSEATMQLFVDAGLWLHTPPRFTLTNVSAYEKWRLYADQKRVSHARRKKRSKVQKRISRVLRAPSPDAQPLHELAERYHKMCELYDQSVCTGGQGCDGVLPANGREMAMINTHARAVFEGLVDISIPDCRTRLRQAIAQYSKRNLKCEK